MLGQVIDFPISSDISPIMVNSTFFFTNKNGKSLQLKQIYLLLENLKRL